MSGVHFRVKVQTRELHDILKTYLKDGDTPSIEWQYYYTSPSPTSKYSLIEEFLVTKQGEECYQNWSIQGNLTRINLTWAAYNLNEKQLTIFRKHFPQCHANINEHVVIERVEPATEPVRPPLVWHNIGCFM